MHRARVQHLVLFDGVCGLCNRLVRFVLAHDRAGVFRFAALQGATGRALVARAGGDPDALGTFYVFERYSSGDGRVLARGRAALFIAAALGWPWKAARILGLVPTPLLDRVYDIVARSRYRIAGRGDRCLVPTPDVRERFID